MIGNGGADEGDEFSGEVEGERESSDRFTEHRPHCQRGGLVFAVTTQIRMKSVTYVTGA